MKTMNATIEETPKGLLRAWQHPSRGYYWSLAELGGWAEGEVQALKAGRNAPLRDIERFPTVQAASFFVALRQLSARLVGTKEIHYYIDIVEPDGTVSGVHTCKYFGNEEFTVRIWARNDDDLKDEHYFLAQHTLRDVLKCKYKAKTRSINVLQHSIPVRNDVEWIDETVELRDVSFYMAGASGCIQAYCPL